MIDQEGVPARLLKMQALLTPEQVPSEILQAVTKDIRDLTMAPNPDIALALQLYSEDPDKAEIMAGETYHRKLKRLAEKGRAQRAEQRKHHRDIGSMEPETSGGRGGRKVLVVEE